MKKIFTLATALILTFSLFAFPDPNLLTISSNTKYPVSLAIDNRDFTQRSSSDNDFIVKDIRPGYHNIKIYREKSKWYNNKSINNKQRLLYNGTVYVKPGFHVDITINRFGKAFIDERKISNSSYFDEDDNNSDWKNDQHPHSMNINEFSQFKQTINNGSFESTKLALAKQTIGQNYFTSAQVKEIVQLFSFETSKLEIAKYAYKYSIDQDNYFVVSDALGYSSSKEELAAFLQTAQ